jgi:hypothetical protein
MDTNPQTKLVDRLLRVEKEYIVYLIFWPRSANHPIKLILQFNLLSFLLSDINVVVRLSSGIHWVNELYTIQRPASHNTVMQSCCSL